MIIRRSDIDKDIQFIADSIKKHDYIINSIGMILSPIIIRFGFVLLCQVIVSILIWNIYSDNIDDLISLLVINVVSVIFSFVITSLFLYYPLLFVSCINPNVVKQSLFINIVKSILNKYYFICVFISVILPFVGMLLTSSACFWGAIMIVVFSFAIPFVCFLSIGRYITPVCINIFNKLKMQFREDDI